MRSRSTMSSDWPATAFTARPTQSVAMEYSQASPGSRTSGASKQARRPVRGAGMPVRCKRQLIPALC